MPVLLATAAEGHVLRTCPPYEVPGVHVVCVELYYYTPWGSLEWCMYGEDFPVEGLVVGPFGYVSTRPVPRVVAAHGMEAALHVSNASRLTFNDAVRGAPPESIVPGLLKSSGPFD